MSDAPATRHDRTSAAIRAAALARLRRYGNAGLGMRAIARELDLTPGALYRYFDGRDDLLTALIADGFHALADSMQVAVVTAPDSPANSPGSRLRAAAMGYRDWAIANPHWFGLLFGPPIPGYAAPPDGPTNVGMDRVGAIFLEPLAQCFLDGRLRTHDDAHLSAATQNALMAGMVAALPDMPAEAISAALAAWGRIHGLVSLEVFGQLAWMLADAGDLFAAELELMIGDLGLV